MRPVILDTGAYTAFKRGTPMCSPCCNTPRISEDRLGLRRSSGEPLIEARAYNDHKGRDLRYVTVKASRSDSLVCPAWAKTCDLKGGHRRE